MVQETQAESGAYLLKNNAHAVHDGEEASVVANSILSTEKARTTDALADSHKVDAPCIIP